MVLQGRGLTEWLGSAINRITWRHRLACVDVAGMPWVEIDYPEDLERAQRFVWPAIAGRLASGAVSGVANAA